MEQLELQSRSFELAFEADIHTAGGWHVVAKRLFPGKFADSPRNAINHLRNCVNPNHAQKLDDEDRMLIWQLVRDKGTVPVSIVFICDELNLSTPALINPEDEKAALQRQVMQSVATFESLVSRLEKIK